jgi:hypothetical protein
LRKKDRAIRSGGHVAAPARRVWEILADFAAYPAWNPFIREIAGTPTMGSKLLVRIELPTFGERTFRPVVLVATPARELRWRGHFLMPGLFDGEHSFLVDPEGDGCRFRQDEVFSGILLRWSGQEFWMALRSGFEEMNAALKRRAEDG